MAVINKYQIRRYKEVVIDVPAGIVDDGGFSTFQLDNPDMILNPPNGTSDFFGTIKKVVLLGEVVKETLDTGNVGIGQFNQLTQQDFQNQLNLGRFVYNKDNGGKATVIGWVELGETYPSFYYEDCVVGASNGKRPVSENYYDLDYFDVSPYTVSGAGVGQAALQQIGNWNYGDSMGNWGPLPFPRQENLTLDQYMEAVLKGGEIQGIKVTELRSDLLGSIPMLISDYEEHFLGNNSKYTLSPSFANNNGNSRIVYARIRRTINRGFKPSSELQKNSRECISTGLTTTTTTTTTTTVTPVGNENIYSKLFYTTDNALTDKFGNNKIESINEEILYSVKGDSYDVGSIYTSQIQSISSKWTYSENVFNQINPFDRKYIDPDVEPPDIDPRPAGSEFDKPNFPRPIDSLLYDASVFSYNAIRINMFRRPEESQWIQKKSLNFNFDPSSTVSYVFYPESDTSIFDTKIKISSFSSNIRDYLKNISDYKNRLILIKEESIKSYKDITG